MVILGVDPGTLITGYGIIETSRGKMKMLACGAVTNASKHSMPLRLKHIYDTLNQVMNKFHPDEFAIETAFYGKNPQSALKLGHARGVAMLAAVEKEIPTSEYSPREVKKAIVGNGTASKEQVQYMIKSLLGLRAAPEKYDITDALAVAICHMHRLGSRSGTVRSWKAYVSAHPEKISRSMRKPK